MCPKKYHLLSTRWLGGFWGSKHRSSFVPWSRLSRFIGDGHPTFNRNPYNGYINHYYWVDDHPLLYGNIGSLDPGTLRRKIHGKPLATLISPQYHRVLIFGLGPTHVKHHPPILPMQNPSLWVSRSGFQDATEKKTLGGFAWFFPIHFPRPKDHWTLQWKGLNLHSRGWILKIASFEGSGSLGRGIKIKDAHFGSLLTCELEDPHEGRWDKWIDLGVV